MSQDNKDRDTHKDSSSVSVLHSGADWRVSPSRGREAEEWVSVLHRKSESGIRVYIDKHTIQRALLTAGINPNIEVSNLRVKRLDMFSGNKGEAQVLLKFKVK